MDIRHRYTVMPYSWRFRTAWQTRRRKIRPVARPVLHRPQQAAVGRARPVAGPRGGAAGIPAPGACPRSGTPSRSRTAGARPAPRCATGHQDAGLQRGGAAQVVFAAQPADVGMAPHDARCGARHVGQHGVEGLAVPPGVRSAASAACSRTRSPPRPRRSRFWPTRSRRPASASRASRSMSASSSRWAVLPPGPRRRPAPACRRPEPAIRRLRAGVLDRPPALGEARQLDHRPGRRHHQAGRAHRLGRQAGVLERSQHLFAAGAAAVHAQGQRGRQIGGLQDRLPVLRISHAQLLDPPAGGSTGPRGCRPRPPLAPRVRAGSGAGSR